MSIPAQLRERFSSALSPLVDDVEPLLEMIRPSQDPRFGDYQANCAMPLKASLGKAPREIAQQIVDALDVDDLCDPPEIAGPGFINLRLKDSVIAQRIEAITGDDRLGVPAVRSPRHYVVDFSSPNVAKPMHVGHLRSTVIGDAICRTLRFAGHKVTSDNHVGDWGTQFGMIIYGYRHLVDQAAYQQDAVAELARLYKLVNQLTDYHASKSKLDSLEQVFADKQKVLAELEASSDKPDKKAKKAIKGAKKQAADAQEAINSANKKIQEVESDAGLKTLGDQHMDIARLARLETSKLHAGDADNQQLWDEFLPACMEALNRVYDRLSISFDLVLGESFYNPQLADVVKDLQDKKLAVESDGATCVFVEDNDAPFIVQKSDGAYTYATTDLATIQYRAEELKADEVLYVVDKRQSEHFQLLFQTVRQWGYESLPCRHISFGTVMGKDGKPYKTREGIAVGLLSLVEEAIVRAKAIVNKNDDDRDVSVLSQEDRHRIAEIVGIGGVKYADLRHNRESDYIFDWDKMLAKTGDTATYMQYAYARICGIFRKLEVDRAVLKGAGIKIQLPTPEERALALQLLSFDEAISATLADFRPNQLTAWLFELAGKLSTFYPACPVKDAETEELRNSRLVLCDLTARALRTGLSLLGIETADVM